TVLLPVRVSCLLDLVAYFSTYTTLFRSCFLDVAVSSTTVARHPLAAAAATGASPYGAAASTSDLGFCAISLDDKPLSSSALALSPRSRTVVEALMRHPRG